MARGPRDDVALRVLAGLDGDRVVAGIERGGKERAVLARVRVPAVAVPHALGAEDAVVGHHLVAVDHVHVPGRAVLQRQAADAHVFAVAQVDQPRAHAAGDRVVVFARCHQRGVFGEVVLQPLPLAVDHPQAEHLAAAGNRATAVDEHVLAVRPGRVIHVPEVQHARVARHLIALKAARDARQIVLHVRRALQHRALVEEDLHVAVAAQRARHVHARREIDAVAFPAVVKGALERGGVERLSVAASAIGRLRHVDAASARGRLCLRGQGNRPGLRLTGHAQFIAGLRRKAFDRAVRAVRLHRLSPVERHGIGLLRRGRFRLVPVQGQRVVRRAHKEFQAVHRVLPSSHERVTLGLPP